MTTLAQDFLENGYIPLEFIDNDKDLELVSMAYEATYAALTPYKDAKFAFSDDKDAKFAFSDEKAEKFVFDDDVVEIIKRLGREKTLNLDAAFRSLHMPSKLVWIEYRIPFPMGGRGKFGFMAAKDVKTESGSIIPLVLICISESPKGPIPVAIFKLTTFPLEEYNSYQLIWSIKNIPKVTDLMYEFFCNLFMIIIPKVCEVRNITFKSSLQKRRIEKGKEPLIEYKKLTVRIGKPSIKYKYEDEENLSEAEKISRRKYHHVIGHFRTYTEGRETPHVTFVEDHWRGDPELGIIIHERELKK